MFKDELRVYREAGAEALKPELPSMTQRAMDVKASLDYMHFVADVCMDLGAFGDAKGILHQAGSRFGESNVLLNLVAFCAWSEDAEDEAFEAYIKSLEKNPGNVSSLRGACYLAIEKDRPNAIGYCRRFYDASGRTHESAVWYATALHNYGKQAELAQLVEEWQEEFGLSEELEDFISKS